MCSCLNCCARDSLCVARSGIESMGLTNYTDILIVADHGMTNNTAEKTIFIDDYLNMSTVRAQRSAVTIDAVYIVLV